jgi:hypothetical protein
MTSNSDTVAELDRFVEAWRGDDVPLAMALQRARDEILALRDCYRREVLKSEELYRRSDAVRAEALEEAARLLEGDSFYEPHIAAAIRALKDA